MALTQLESLNLRISEVGEDIKLHRHFLTLSLDATKLRLRQTFTISLVQYGVMILFTAAAVRDAHLEHLAAAPSRVQMACAL